MCELFNHVVGLVDGDFDSEVYNCIPLKWVISLEFIFEQRHFKFEFMEAF